MAPPAAPRSGLIVNAGRSAELAAPAAPVLCNSHEHRLPIAQGLRCRQPDPLPGGASQRLHPWEMPPWYPGALAGAGAGASSALGCDARLPVGVAAGAGALPTLPVNPGLPGCLPVGYRAAGGTGPYWG